MLRAAELLAVHLPHAKIVGVAVRNEGKERPFCPPDVCRLSSPEELEDGFADLVIEAADHTAVLPWGKAALERARVFSPLSIGALADKDCHAQLVAAAERYGSRIMVPSGAIGGLDALRSMSYGGLDSVVHEIVKPIAAWKGSEAENRVELDLLREPTTFLELSAGEAARRFPQNANVCAMVALAGLGLEKTRVRLTADPGAKRNRHMIIARGPSGEFMIRLDNNAVSGNARSSEMTALSLVRLVEQLTAPLVW